MMGGRMKNKRLAAAFLSCLLVAEACFAAVTIDDLLDQLPSDVLDAYEILGGDSYVEEINRLLEENNVTEDTDLQYVIDIIVEVYADEITDILYTDTPLTTVLNGLSGFCDVLADSIPNAQLQQNVWAPAWIGNFLHFGFGINVGVADLDISVLKEAAISLGIDEVSDVQDNLYFPTVTADIRIGGVFLPFDVGFTFFSLDTSDLGSTIADAIDPITFSLYAVGVDVRYALLKGRAFFKPRMSVIAGFYYTDGGVYVNSDDAKASLDFQSVTVTLGAQASVKFMCFVPFAGIRGLFTKTTVDWYVEADWAEIISEAGSDYYAALGNAVDWGILPASFGGSNSSDFKFHPQIYGGFGLDLLALDITFSGSYDLVSYIGSLAVSIRIAL